MFCFILKAIIHDIYALNNGLDNLHRLVLVPHRACLDPVSKVVEVI